MAWKLIEEKPNWEFSDTPNTDKKLIDHYDYDNFAVHTNGVKKFSSGEKFVLARQRYHDHPGYGELYISYPVIDSLYDSGNVAWGYTLPDDSEIRNSTGWISGSANTFYDANGVPIAASGAAILADQFINTWNVLFVEVDEVLETGRIIVYPLDLTYYQLASLMRKHDIPVMESLYIDSALITIDGNILTINKTP